MASVSHVRFEHYHPTNSLGVQDSQPRISWRIQDASSKFQQQSYEIELTIEDDQPRTFTTGRYHSSASVLIPWPLAYPLRSRQKVAARVRVWDKDGSFNPTAWSEPAHLEAGLLERTDWQCDRIAAPWSENALSNPEPEDLHRKQFLLPISESLHGSGIRQARLYITAQGVYEAEINGRRVGDHFMAPGWTSYSNRLQYQTYDVTSLVHSHDNNCIGIRVAEGWFCGRIGFEGGHRNIWGSHPSLMAQLEIVDGSGHTTVIGTDSSWTVTQGPIRQAEIYDGEKYDATLEIPNWSCPMAENDSSTAKWSPVHVMSPLPSSIKFTASCGEPVRRIEIIKPAQKIETPSGKTILDFGQNLVGYVRVSGIKGPCGHKIALSHAEVLENGELGTRPLRICKAIDEYTLKGGGEAERYEPRFAFHGFRYVQIDGWTDLSTWNENVEAVVCHNDMTPNVCWGMRGNFLSVPTDCPQRDERLGWSGDLALFAPTATLIYDCFAFLKNWLIDVEYEQKVLNGVPAMVVPNATLPDPIWCRRVPCAIWHDVTILAPWELYQETGDVSILAQQYASMTMWMDVLPRNKTDATHLWDTSVFQLGDWLDPMAPPHAPWKGATDARMVANAFLIHSLDIMARISEVIEKTIEAKHFTNEAKMAREEFHAEYVTANGRIVSDSQTAYALAICFNLLSESQQRRAGERLVYLVRKNEFKIGTGFAGTPFVCEALARTGHINIAYSMLLEKECPSWLYPVTMGATTMWERWDSMLPDGSINPGEMTSFNHYSFGAIAKFMYERIAGLQRLEPGWRKCRVCPAIGADFSNASASHVTPNGLIACSWETIPAGEKGSCSITLTVTVPPHTTCEVVLPDGLDEMKTTVGHGEWNFATQFQREYEWPVKPLPPKS